MKDESHDTGACSAQLSSAIGVIGVIDADWARAPHSSAACALAALERSAQHRGTVRAAGCACGKASQARARACRAPRAPPCHRAVLSRGKRRGRRRAVICRHRSASPSSPSDGDWAVVHHSTVTF